MGTNRTKKRYFLAQNYDLTTFHAKKAVIKARELRLNEARRTFFGCFWAHLTCTGVGFQGTSPVWAQAAFAARIVRRPSTAISASLHRLWARTHHSILVRRLLNPLLRKGFPR
jgi:hypothetical protein